MLGRDSGHDSASAWRVPIGASLCGIGGVGNPMPMDFLGGHTLGSVTFSAVALGLFVAGTIWMFRRWGRAGDAPPPVTIAEDESEAIWAELERGLDGEPNTEPVESHEPV